MSNRLNQEREAKLQPSRMATALNELHKLKCEIEDTSNTTIRFRFKGNLIFFYPYSGWYQGKGIKPGRGLENLLNQLR